MPALRLVALAVVFLATLNLSAVAAEKPNIVLIFVDDLGWKDIGCYGNDFVETASDRSARRRRHFVSPISMHPVRCVRRPVAPSSRDRIKPESASRLTSLGIGALFERVQTPRPLSALPAETVTVAETLRTAGYRTGYIGKWHLGSDAFTNPAAQGYDFAVEINGPHYEGRYRSTNKNFQPKPGQYRTDFEADLAQRLHRGICDGTVFLDGVTICGPHSARRNERQSCQVSRQSR